MTVETTERICNENPFLDNLEMANFIVFRSIHSEDLPLILDLNRYPTSLFIDMHNYFTSAQERSADKLRVEADHYRQQNEPAAQRRAEFYTLLADFTEKYDYTVTNHLCKTIRKIRNGE